MSIEPQSAEPSITSTEVPSGRLSAVASPAPADPKAQPKLPFESAAKVVRVIELASVRFSDYRANAFEGAEKVPDDVTVAISNMFLRPTVVAARDGFATRTTLLLRVEGKAAQALEDASPKLLAVVQATLEARYTFKAESPEFTDEDLRDYALCYCPFHVWGYWREFVQSSLARLNLPSYTMPLFLIHQATTMVRDKLD